MSVTESDLKLLHLLSDGHFHSGTELAATLGISRQSISKHLQSLSDHGVEYTALTGKGYRLTQPLQLLAIEDIQSQLSLIAQSLFQNLILLPTIPSTNQYLSQLAYEEAPSGTVVIAEHQTQGKGRRGNHWITPLGRNLAFSVLWRFQAGPSVLSGLSLAVGVAVVRALQQLGFNEASLKWPNDIFVHQKKLGGILIEVSGEQSGPCHAVIGLGLNIALPSMTDLAIDQPYTDLVTEAGVQYLRARNSLIAAVLNQLGTLLENYEKEGLTPYIEEWRQLDAFKSQSVYIKNGEQKIEGVAQGITEDGFLQIIDLDGNLKTFASGEVSLRLRG